MNKRTDIGQIIGVHALGGEFKVRPLTDYPDRFFSMETLSLYRGDDFVRSLKINTVRCLEARNKTVLLFGCEGVSNVDEAHAIVGCAVSVPNDERVELPKGEFWIDELIGMEVVQAGERLGTVKELVRSGGNELYVVEGLDGKERLIPAVEEFIKKIDLPSRTITVSLIEGLW